MSFPTASRFLTLPPTGITATSTSATTAQRPFYHRRDLATDRAGEFYARTRPPNRFLKPFLPHSAISFR